MSEPTTEFLVGRGDHGKRLDHFLHERIPGLSRTRIQQAIRERVTLSWAERARPSTPVRGGGEVRIGYTPLHEELLEIAIPVLVRGAGWLAVDKPAGIPVHPVNKIRENSLIRILRRQESCEALRLAHRLDRETSGVLLVADARASARSLSVAFARGEIEKRYVARVHGHPTEDSGAIDLPIGEAIDSAIYTKRQAGHGQSARTCWRVIERGQETSLLSLEPSTGRRHQLRVHLAAIGHPIVGDILYAYPERAYLSLVSGEGDVRENEEGPKRQLLHCASLAFEDPGGSGLVRVEAPLPKEFDLGG